MQNSNDLFDLRAAIGSKIKKQMEQQAISKAELCRETGMSRPTLDKMISGSITNKTNYDKHISKIMDCLGISSDVLLGNIKKNRTRNIREILRKSIEDIAKFTGISVDRLKDIEDGAEATLTELRDIAMCFSTSVNVIQEKNFFEPQLAEMDLLISTIAEKGTNDVSGFWGHVGIRISRGKKYKWFPITRITRKFVYQDMENKYMVIPCMNNKVLFLNMDNIDRVVLLDDACDPPADLDWPMWSGEEKISEGEVPQVLYELLEDYCFGELTEISDNLHKCLEGFVREYKISEEEMNDIVSGIEIYYADGLHESDTIYFGDNENISEAVSYVYDHDDYDDYDCMDEVLYYTGYCECENLIKLKNIAMLELPFIKLENAIIEKNDL